MPSGISTTEETGIGSESVPIKFHPGLMITESLIRRLRSREENNFTDRMISIMRGAFGGHGVKKSTD